MPSDQYWFCPDCINQDTKVIIGKGKAVNEQSLSKNRIYIRDVDCVIGKKRSFVELIVEH